MNQHPLIALADLPGVARAHDTARAAIDELLWDRGARRRGEELAAESAIVGAWCSAAFEGAEVPIETLRAGAVERSAMGTTAARTLAMYSELPGIADRTLGHSPLQGLARMHALVVGAGGDGVGRPRSSDAPEDPLRLGDPLPARAVGPRLVALAGLLTDSQEVPALVVAGVVHAELATVLPFEQGSGLVARALTRGVLRGRGVDPDGWSIPEAGVMNLGRPAYVKALRAYRTGTPEGVATWLVHHAQCVAVGAQEASGWVARQQD